MRLIPILFSGPMVRAILEGRKTQTRRIVKPQPIQRSLGCMYANDWSWARKGSGFGRTVSNSPSGPSDIANDCPYGQPGDVLWVRESFYKAYKSTPTNYGAMYRADDDGMHLNPGAVRPSDWKPSIHMPYAACRLWLRVKSVRVERVQDISAKDILDEGAVDRPHDASNIGLGKCPVSAFDGVCYPDLRSLWAAGWVSINGKGSWAANPWVWVVEYERTEKPGGAA